MRAQQRADMWRGGSSSFASTFYMSSLSNSFAPSSSSRRAATASSCSASGSSGSSGGVGFNKYNFLASSFRFLLDARALHWPSTQRALAATVTTNASAAAHPAPATADAFVEWDAVRLVLSPSLPDVPPPACAICLDPPCAPYEFFSHQHSA
jgi:hypothetical protein